KPLLALLFQTFTIRIDDSDSMTASMAELLIEFNNHPLIKDQFRLPNILLIGGFVMHYLCTLPEYASRRLLKMGIEECLFKDLIEDFTEEPQDIDLRVETPQSSYGQLRQLSNVIINSLGRRLKEKSSKSIVASIPTSDSLIKYKWIA